MNVVVLLGAPGAGKGTQAAVLVKRLGLLHVATGDLFRAAIRQQTPLGIQAKTFMDAGQLVPDDITIRMLLERIDRPDAHDGVILDGFPRTAAQAAALDTALAARGSRVAAALLIDVPADALVERLSGRWICSASGHVYHADANPPRAAGTCDIDGSALVQRDDDRPDVIRARLAGQLDALEAVIDHYQRSGVLRSVDGLRPIAAVSEALLDALSPAVGSAERD